MSSGLKWSNAVEVYVSRLRKEALVASLLRTVSPNFFLPPLHGIGYQIWLRQA